MNQIEFKKHYNTTLKRIAEGEEYYKTHKIDKYYNNFKGLIYTQNALLERITDATVNEILNGFIIENENVGVKTDTEMAKLQKESGQETILIPQWCPSTKKTF